ncbi:LOW QUALITY PROTEIN: von Willebrand factor A domain-containing protein 7-like [Trematomus bernacchii]|uniref:LOW QUALITY PROTEIN: von Willebrand factor A domain-containing protein 7-like n=1 Tax=Trematomus bernacchii TaxID=40690 RepID=UPI00146A99FD|nr:LOW QUALITY PROTEIN: von Willebrand factor A domain-containing protein 7-like [Trematomus bernacchii]
MFGLAALWFLLLQTGAFGFDIYFFGVGLWSSSSETHEDITQRAILNATVQACRALARAEGKDFTFPPLTAESVVACEASKSSKSFSKAIKLIQKKNRQTDERYFYSAPHHFDDEQFLEGRRLITEGLSVVKASNKRENFEAAREKLGRILHTLQDFYSHSNWVEMGNKLPNSNLFREGTSIGNIAAKDRATCRNCDGKDCRNNILEDILQEKILISGYFALNLPLISSSKPEGKCSHGGYWDKTRKTEPKGGINKDKVGSDHGHLHMTAANMAVAATSELLEDIRWAAGDKTFLQLMGINKGSSKALCFVIDTTGSMSDDIDAVRAVTSSIINSKVGTKDEPSLYILVPFNDPDFGPLLKTTDPNVFKNAINSLRAEGGGDSPEMSLSGLQLALTGAPPESEIFLFTDAPAKDTHLKSTVIALIERTKSVVNFMTTKVLRSRRDSRVSDAALYRDLAQVSGGLAIEVTKAELPAATSIITQSSTSSLVTLLQANRNPGKADNFTFSVDESVRNVTVYITGTSTTFTLTNPSGVSQESTNNRGPLITASQSVGNFQTLQLEAETGLWEIKFVSTNPYILKVVGVSAIDFLFDFLEVSQGPLGGLEIIDNRPRAGVNGSLLVTVTGSDTAVVTEVILVESSGLRQVIGSVEAKGGGNYLARFDRIPAEEFVVLVKGQNNNGSSRAILVGFQRQSTTSIRASTVTVRSPDTAGVLEPGTPLSVSFSVATSGAGGTFSIQATNDQNFDSSFSSSLIVETGSTANGAVNITAPSNTPSGTDVTLTIEAEAPGGAGANYVVLRFTVLTPVTDFAPPVCQNVSLQANCSDSCSLSMWELSVQVTDGEGGSGVDRVSLRQGNGTLNTSLAAGNITMVSYDASCCSPDVELVVVDEVGNVATCFYSITRTVVVTATTQSPKVPTAAPVVSLSSRAVPSFLLCFCITILGLNLPF